ncbi:MAG: guanine deaminase [Gammaproteobacteria bacterium]|nr:guanine deaminase [Gammaproteobacteria bacterium]MDH3534385.1 guanine deaminase [Gammaproteobacteria bacterium]
MTVVPAPLDNDSCDTAIRADFVHFLSDPDNSGDAVEYIEDGLLLLKQGRVRQLVPAADWIDFLPDGSHLYDYSGRLVMPGFIDTHTHYPQTEMIASHGLQLLDWLQQYTFPTEMKFAEREHADRIAAFFCEQMLRNGTTTSAVFATVHAQSVDAIFEQAQRRDLCLVAGKVMMDRNAPPALCDSAESSYRDCSELIRRWHLKGRCHYAVTPRFAPCSSPAQLEICGQLLAEQPDLYLQSHLAENRAEVDWVARLFPDSRSYLDVYDSFGLLGPRSIYGHCIHLDRQDRERMAASGAAIAFCPTSNLFLGSGLFRLDDAREQGIRVGVATDVGAGTSFSMLQTLAEAYKVCQLAGQRLTPLKAFYLATLGAAQALYLDHRIGNFGVGKEADLVVLELGATELMQCRMENASTLEERLFALMMLGDDRCVQATHVMGKRQYSRNH